SSTDPGYSGLAVAPVRVAITDNDLPQHDPVFGAPATNPFGLTSVGARVSPTFADIDGESDSASCRGKRYSKPLFYRNTASAGATSPFGLTSVGRDVSPAFADIDGDGDLDAFVGNDYGNTLFYRNAASAGATAPSFSAPATNPFGLGDVGASARPTFADVDG